jgi:hypothetical protein
VPGAARAGTYDVTSCNPDGTAAGWSSYGGSSFARGITCPTGGDLNNRGLGAADMPNVGMLGYSAGGLMFQAPAGTSLAGIGGGVRVQRWDSTYWLGLIAGSGQNLYGYWANDGTPAQVSAYTPNRWFPLNHESNVHVEVGCSGWCDTSLAGYAGYRAWAQMFDPITVRIEDDDAPVETVTGGGLVTNAYATGTQAVTFGATDASGIRSTHLYVDGAKLRDDVRGCNFEQPVPCSNLSAGSYSLDTTTLADGSHGVKVETVDSAGNAAAQIRPISVDNRAPAAPVVSVTGGEGWRSSNSFAVSWTTPDVQVAPVVKARYQICRADQPAVCQPAGVQSGTNIGWLSGLSVPSEGDYTVTVWLEDAAGNTSASSASAPVHLRYDASAPARVSDLRLAGGESWRPKNAFDLTWDNPTGQLAPITSAHYRLCDASGQCTAGTQNGAAGMSSLSGLRVPAAGSYTLTLWVGDEAGNSNPASASDAVALRFDDTDPGQAEPQPSNGWLNAADVAGGYDETIRDAVSPPSGIAGFAMTIDGSEPGRTPDSGPEGLVHIPELPEGTVAVKARAISNSGIASSRVGSAVLLVDKTAPRLDVSEAPDPDKWQPRPVTLGINAEDELSGMDSGHITYSVDGGPERTVAGRAASVTVGDDGEHTVAYAATDAAGNSSAEHRLSFKLDTTPPADAALSDPGRWLNATSAVDYAQHVGLSPNARAPLSGVAGYSFTTDGSFPDETIEASGDTLHLGALAEGTTVVKARAVSGSGLASEHETAVALRVDRTPPEVRLRGLSDADRWEPAAVRMTVSGSDELSGMDGGHVEYGVDGGDWKVVPGGSADIEVRGDGTHTVRYRGVDTAGNRTDEQVGHFKIDGEKPGMAVPASSDGWVPDPGSYAERIGLGDGEVLPPSGLAGFSIAIDGSTPDETADVGPDGVLALDDLVDGVTVVKARAVSGAGIASDAVGSGMIKVDRTAPVVAIHSPDASSPDSLVADVSDATSGVESSRLELRSEGASEWIDVPSELNAGRMSATLDRVGAATYAVRVTAVDAAGNKTVATAFANGDPATVTVGRPPAAEHGSETSPVTGAQGAVAAPRPGVAPSPHRCLVKRHKRTKHHSRHGRKAKVRRPCGHSRHNGGEKHRRRHLGGKTHNRTRGTAG